MVVVLLTISSFDRPLTLGPPPEQCCHAIYFYELLQSAANLLD